MAGVAAMAGSACGMTAHAQQTWDLLTSTGASALLPAAAAGQAAVVMPACALLLHRILVIF